eukprot:gene15010-12059_t
MRIMTDSGKNEGPHNNKTPVNLAVAFKSYAQYVREEQEKASINASPAGSPAPFGRRRDRIAPLPDD